MREPKILAVELREGDVVLFSNLIHIQFKKLNGYIKIVDEILKENIKKHNSVNILVVELKDEEEAEALVSIQLKPNEISLIEIVELLTEKLKQRDE